MKTCLILSLACILTGALGGSAAIAQQSPVPVVITPTQAQYKVVDINRLSLVGNLTPAGTLEAILNELASQGWKVVTTSGSFIILSRAS